MLERAIVRALGIVREAAPRQLLHLQVELDAVAAQPLARAGLIAAVAALQVAFLFAVHIVLLDSLMWMYRLYELSIPPSSIIICNPIDQGALS